MEPTPPTPPTSSQNLAEESSPSELSPESSVEVEVKLDTTPQNYYQAIGWLRGKISKAEDRFQVQIKDSLFPLYLPRRVMAVANNHIDQVVWIKCYPQSKGEGLSFKAVWMGTEQAEKGEPGIFVLRGIWQFIPQCRRPVFTIYRNELKNYENRPSNQHLPLIWADQPPYRFRKDSEEKPKFCQIMARLIPQRACFGFVSQIAEPQDVAPRRVKKPPMEGTNLRSKSRDKTAGNTEEAAETETTTEKSIRPPKPQKKSKAESKAPDQAESSGESPSDSLVAASPEASVELVVETPQETPVEPSSVELAAATPVASPEETSVALSTEAPVESSVETPVETPVELAIATPEPKPVKTTTTRKTKGKTTKAKSKSKTEPDSASE